MKKGIPEANDLVEIAKLLNTFDELNKTYMEVKFYVPEKRLNTLDVFYYKLKNPDDKDLKNFKYGDTVNVIINGINFVFEKIKKSPDFEENE